MSSINTIPILTSRFSSVTWYENVEYRRRKEYLGCIYGCPHRLATKIPLGKLIFIIEMNNSINKIEGVGLIRNTIATDRYYKVYDNNNYNRYIYRGDYHVDREVLEHYNAELVKVLELLLFKGKTHLKRGSGFTSMNDKLLKHEKCKNINIEREMREIFKNYFQLNKIVDEDNIEK
jgi:hypothetical protein